MAMNIMQIMTAFKAKDGLTPMFKRSAKQSALFNSQFGRGIRGMNMGVNKFMRVGVRSFAAVGTAATLMGGAVYAATNQIASMGDEIAKTSRQIGISGEALQEWRFVAERQGVNNETLTKSFKLLNRNIGDVRLGQGMLTTTLNRSNPALLEQLKNTTDSEKAFELMVKEIGKLTNAQDKAALAQAAFGRGGQDIIKLSEAGAKGIDELRKKARELGLIMGEDATKQAEKFKDAQTNLESAFTGLKITLLTGIMPAITGLTDKFATFIALNRKDFLKKTNIGFKNLVIFLKSIWKYRNTIKVIAISVASFVIVIKTLNAALMTYNTISTAFTLITALMTKSQLSLNLAMMLNPIGLTIIAVGAAIGLFALLASRVGGVKNAFGVLFSFIKAGAYSFAQLIANYFLLPLQGLLFMLTKLPGMGGKFEGAFQSVKGIRESINAGASQARQEAGAAGRSVIQGQPTQSTSNVNINLSSADGTTAEIEGDTSPSININNMTLAPAQ